MHSLVLLTKALFMVSNRWKSIGGIGIGLNVGIGSSIGIG